MWVCVSGKIEQDSTHYGNDCSEVLLDEMVDAIPTLLHRMNLLAGMPGHVVPDTTRQILRLCMVTFTVIMVQSQIEMGSWWSKRK